MHRKLFAIIMLLIISILMVACSQKKKGVDTVEEEQKARFIKYDEIGVAFDVPNQWYEVINSGRNIELVYEEPEENLLGHIVLNYMSDELVDKLVKLQELRGTDADEEELQNATARFEELLNQSRNLCRILTVDKSITEENVQKELFNKYDNKYLIGKEDNFEFYLLYNNEPDTEGLTEEAKRELEENYVEIENFKSLIDVYKPISETEKVSKNKLEFTTKTLEGSEVDSSLLGSSKITMVNVWGTFCNPCIDEMPDIQSLYEEVLGDGVNIIGIVSDTPDKDNEELAKKILSEKGVKYTNIIPDETIMNNITNNISAVPTTFFVDSEGNIIGDLVVGSRSKEQYKTEIMDRLKIINN